MINGRVRVPSDYDYVGVYLTDKCHLRCAYCITRHHGAPFGFGPSPSLSGEAWSEGLNRLRLPEGVPLTLQGGEPFLHKGIWTILERATSKVDILTALPPFVSRQDFLQLGSLAWNQRPAPYPTIRVSYHRGQNDYRELIERIGDLQEVLSIGLYYLEHPACDPGEEAAIHACAARFGVEVRKKEYLGIWNGKQYGTYRYQGAASGLRQGYRVRCRNTVVPIGPDGTIYRCHSDLYFLRRSQALGSILDANVSFPEGHLSCEHYGLCSECDVKVKTNHLQQFGYTSVDIQFQDQEGSHVKQETESPDHQSGVL